MLIMQILFFLQLLGLKFSAKLLSDLIMQQVLHWYRG